MQQIFESFLNHLNECADESDFEEAMASTARKLDLRTFAYLALPANSDNAPKLISNYPNVWTSHYLQSGYEAVDPVIERLISDECPFRWGAEFEFSGATKKQQQFLNEASEFGICRGLTIPVHDPRGCIAAVTFAADEKHELDIRP